MARKKPSPKPAVTCPSCGRRAVPGARPLNFCPHCGADLRSPVADDAGPGALLQKVIAERYRLIALLGEGGMGAVYKAEHIRMGKAIALKILRPEFAREEGAVERFTAEARIVSRLSHPHTIAVFDFGEIDGGGFYLAMEYVPGKDLAAVLRETGRLPEARVAHIGVQILGSLAEAHDAGIVHRDIKPGNVMLTPTRSGEDFVKVLDFGIAKLREEGGAGTAAGTATTSAGAIMGTPNYLAPEQARGEAIDGRSDLYAVGCLLYELAAGHPPFQAPTPMAVVSAHLSQPAPSLLGEAPGTSRRFAEVIHRALSKRPLDRYPSADAMGEALLALGETTGTRQGRRPSSPNLTGDLQIARREDFREFDHQVRALRRSRILGPVGAFLTVALAAALIWRWPDVYGLLAARWPAAVSHLPAPLRPGDHFDGGEHEPNDDPARANPLPLPPGPEGAVAVRGHIGAKLSETVGDTDVFRLDVPPAEGRRVLVVEWRGEREGEGIRGLDVALGLNRLRGDETRAPAPLVASADRGGAGRPERLVAAVEPGTHYLAVREKHEAAAGPVEKPTDRYVLEVRLAEPGPGDEVEPNDAPDRLSVPHERYPQWRAVAGRNPLGEGGRVRGETAPDDPDVYALEARGPADAPALVAAVPAPGLALSARLWLPDAEDLAASGAADRVRLEPAGETEPGGVLLVSLPAPPAEGAPALLELRAAIGEGGYDLFLLGDGAASGEAVLAVVGALAAEGRVAPALELAAGYASRLPRAARRGELLVAAGEIADALAPTLSPDAARGHERAALLLGAAVFEEEGGKVIYRGAFEAQVEGEGRAADRAALRLVALAAPCTPEEVARRAAAFLERRPPPSQDLAEAARLVRARALEEAYWTSGGRERARLQVALAAWKALATDATGEPALRAAALGAKAPARGAAQPVCR